MASVAQISDEERAIAIKATQTLGLDVAGVDILRATRGPLVMEVNASPGLEGGNHLRCGHRQQDDRLDRAPGDTGILFENRRLTAGCKTVMVCGAFFA